MFRTAAAARSNADFNLLHDPLAEFRIVAAGLGADSHVIGDDVRRFAALNHADVARARAAVLLDQAVPAALHQIGNGERRDGDRADAFLRPIAGVAGEAFDFDRHAIAARRADLQALRGEPPSKLNASVGLPSFDSRT